MGLADTVLVVLTPESGDVVQTMKAGLLEVADVFAVNKADRPGADGLRRNLELMVHLGMSDEVDEHRWAIPVHTCCALEDRGVDEVAAACMEHLDWIRSAGRRAWDERRADGRMRAFLDVIGSDARLRAADLVRTSGLEAEIRSGAVNAYAAAARWGSTS